MKKLFAILVAMVMALSCVSTVLAADADEFQSMFTFLMSGAMGLNCQVTDVRDEEGNHKVTLDADGMAPVIITSMGSSVAASTYITLDASDLSGVYEQGRQMGISFAGIRFTAYAMNNGGIANLSEDAINALTEEMNPVVGSISKLGAVTLPYSEQFEMSDGTCYLNINEWENGYRVNIDLVLGF